MSGTHQNPSENAATREDPTGARAALLAAVGDAVQAPSIFNTQPWQWGVDETGLTLYADPSRRLAVVDPKGTLQLVSCGAALHHARISLMAQGWSVQTDRLPAEGASGVGLAAEGASGVGPAAEGDGVTVARLRLAGRGSADPAAVALREAIPRRRTDRRPFTDEPVPAGALERLGAAALAEGARLHRVRLDQMPMLAVAVAAAQATELANPRYRIELIQWTNRPEWSRDGVPEETAVQHVPRRVPVRDFTLFPEQGIPVASGGDLGAAYLILHGPGEERLDWLRAGEALSAVLLTAVAEGLAVAPFTDVLEVDHPRQLIGGLLPEQAHPYVVIRCGHAPAGVLPASPRRGVDDVVSPAVDAPVGG